MENGAIDTKLIPCNLPQEFQINNLMVTINGDVNQLYRMEVFVVRKILLSQILLDNPLFKLTFKHYLKVKKGISSANCLTITTK